MNEKDHQIIRTQMLALLNDKGHEKSICPSEVARLCFPNNWREKMKEVREVAKEMNKHGEVLITQRGLVVTLDEVKGPIRIKLPKQRG